MEREIMELRSQLATVTQQKSPNAVAPLIKTPTEGGGHARSLHQIPSHVNADAESGEAIASLMDLATGAEAGSFMRSPNAQLLFSRRLGDVSLSQDQVQELFHM